ncbi:MAG: hypothetical protein AB4058_03175 [Microcystaceae cyanobacterium]
MSLFHLEQQILTLKSLGQVAAPRTWISSYTVTKEKSKKTYTYFRVMEGYKDDKGKKKARCVQYLGKEGSKAHREAQRAIARRNQIQKLERKLNRLKKQKKSVRGSQKKSQVSHLTKKRQETLAHLQGQIDQLKEENRQLWQQINLISAQIWEF